MSRIRKIRIHENDLHLLVNGNGKVDLVLPVKAALTYGPFSLANEAFAIRLAKGKVSTLKTAPHVDHLVYKSEDGEVFDVAVPTLEDWHRFGRFLLSQKEKYGITSWEAQCGQMSDDEHDEFLRECSVSLPDAEGMVVVCFSEPDYCRNVPIFSKFGTYASTNADPFKALSECCSHQVVMERCNDVWVNQEDIRVYGPGEYDWSSRTRLPTLFELTYLYEDENGKRLTASSPDDDGYRAAVAAGRQTRIVIW